MSLASQVTLLAQQIATTINGQRSAVQTLTNKRIVRRVNTQSSSGATLTMDIDSYDAWAITAQAANLTINAPTGTQTNFQSFILRIKDNGTARTLTWNTAFRGIGLTLPATTTISKQMWIAGYWNATDSKWDVTSFAQES